MASDPLTNDVTSAVARSAFPRCAQGAEHSAGPKDASRCRPSPKAFPNLLGAALLIAAADPPDTIATLTALRQQDEAVLRVGERLVVSGVRYCHQPFYSSGMTVQRLGQYGARYRPAAAALMGLTDAPTIALVAAGSAAEQAGLRVGDGIAGADGTPLPAPGPRGDAGEFRPTAAALDVLEAALADGTMTLDIVRDGRPLITAVTGRPACRARFDVRTGRSSNATSDGTTVQVSSRLVADVRGDGELAAVLAHELAHNILHHPQRLTAREAGLSVRRTEMEADRLSVYLLEAAGYAPTDAVAFWSRWGRAHDWGIFADRSHPGWEKRAASIAAEAAVIAAARTAGRPVSAPPELRP